MKVNVVINDDMVRKIMEDPSNLTFEEKREFRKLNFYLKNKVWSRPLELEKAIYLATLEENNDNVSKWEE